MNIDLMNIDLQTLDLIHDLFCIFAADDLKKKKHTRTVAFKACVTKIQSITTEWSHVSYAD